MRAARSLGAAELQRFCSRMYLFVHSGVTLQAALELLSTDRSARSLRLAARELSSSVERRLSLSEGMQLSGRFPPYLISMIRTGELSGNLDGVLESLTRFYRREQRIGERVRNAAAYPLLFIAMMCAVVVFISVQVLPVFEEILTGLGGELGGFVRGLMGAGRFLQGNWFYLMSCLAAAVVMVYALSRTGRGRRYADGIMARLPVFRKLAAARFAGAMSFLLAGGIPLDSALDLGRDMLGNVYMAERLDAERAAMPHGDTISDVLMRSGIFPDDFTGLFRAGFMSGRGDEAMEDLAALYGAETERMLEGIADSVEPVLSIVLSVIVGVILVSVIVPLLHIMSLVG